MPLTFTPTIGKESKIHNDYLQKTDYINQGLTFLAFNNFGI